MTEDARPPSQTPEGMAARKRRQRLRLALEGIVSVTVDVPEARRDELRKIAASWCDQHRLQSPQK